MHGKWSNKSHIMNFGLHSLIANIREFEDKNTALLRGPPAIVVIKTTSSDPKKSRISL
jgi:hypothetical protein